ncbi:hypothetical protein NAT50_07505 [Flavobacterium sp. HXWNR70]|uniref:Uncharacterized protein n=1 Tax=Flavobacterium luminosum TaxID=2949086 RepID=A0ABT0TQ74_9FLAO|nr:hypothetical protein [Flavobacterium sp. HXWNR70]
MNLEQIDDAHNGNWLDYAITIIPFINIIIWVVVIYAIIKLYKKLIKFLDKNS